MRGRTAAALVVLVLLGGLAAAQTRPSAPAAPPAPASPDILPSLLSEVRGLRAAIEGMATTTARVQLSLGRLQLQEQRVTTVLRRLDEVRTRLAAAQTQSEQHAHQLEIFDRSLQGGVGENGKPASPEERVQLEQMVGQLRAMAKQAAGEVQRLTTEEAMLANELASEQNRWIDLNSRLEELERALGRR